MIILKCSSVEVRALKRGCVSWHVELFPRPNMLSCLEGEAAQKALRLCHTQCWRGWGELPVSQEKPGHCGFFPSNNSTFARGNIACHTFPPSARSTEFSGGSDEVVGQVTHLRCSFATNCTCNPSFNKNTPGCSLLNLYFFSCPLIPWMKDTISLIFLLWYLAKIFSWFHLEIPLWGF